MKGTRNSLKIAFLTYLMHYFSLFQHCAKSQYKKCAWKNRFLNNVQKLVACILKNENRDFQQVMTLFIYHGQVFINCTFRPLRSKLGYIKFLKSRLLNRNINSPLKSLFANQKSQFYFKKCDQKNWQYPWPYGIGTNAGPNLLKSGVAMSLLISSPSSGRMFSWQ